MSTTRTAQSLSQYTKQAIIEELKYYFNNVSLFGFPGNPIKVPIIREAYSTNLRNYPIIFVKTLNEKTQSLGLNQGFVADVFSDDQQVGQKYLPGTESFPLPVPYKKRVIAERFGYMSDISLNLQVWGDSVTVRNHISDETIAAIQRYQKLSLLRRNITVLEISQGEDFDVPLNDTTHIFVSNINLTVNTQLFFDYPCAYITAINAIPHFAGNTFPDTPPYIIQTALET